MKKLICITLAITCLMSLAACGTKEEQKTETAAPESNTQVESVKETVAGIDEMPEETVDDGEDESGNGNDATTVIEAIEDAVFGSYQEILDDYSQRLRDATPRLIDEYKEEAKDNQGGLEGLATICNEKVGVLAELVNEGIQEMAQIYLHKGSGSYDEYSEWTGKLQDVYLEEASKIQEAYMASAT